MSYFIWLEILFKIKERLLYRCYCKNSLTSSLINDLQNKDGLAIRYLRHPADLPACCDGCGADFTLQHGMDCKREA